MLIKYVEYGRNFHPIKMLVDAEYLECEPNLHDFIFFDIETLVLPKCEMRKSTQIVSTHKLLSIGANAFIDGKHEQKCWVIKDSTHDSELKIVSEFLNYILEANENRTKDAKVLNARAKIDHDIEKEIEELASINLKRSFRLTQLRKMSNILKPYEKLTVFGFNSQKVYWFRIRNFLR